MADVARDLPPLLAHHHVETQADAVRAPLNFDFGYYFDLDLLGRLAILAVRDGPLLVGYVFTVVGPHTHKRSVLWGSIVMYWLFPAYRVGCAGIRMFRENELLLQAFGVQKITVTEVEKYKNDFGRRAGLIFKRLGYTAEETVYGKWIGT